MAHHKKLYSINLGKAAYAFRAHRNIVRRRCLSSYYALTAALSPPLRTLRYLSTTASNRDVVPPWFHLTEPGHYRMHCSSQTNIYFHTTANHITKSIKSVCAHTMSIPLSSTRQFPNWAFGYQALRNQYILTSKLQPNIVRLQATPSPSDHVSQRACLIDSCACRHSAALTRNAFGGYCTQHNYRKWM